MIKQNFYENGPKSKKTPGMENTQTGREMCIYKVRDSQTNETYHKLEDIQKVFEKYYTNLYAQLEAAEIGAVSGAGTSPSAEKRDGSGLVLKHKGKISYCTVN